MASQKYSQKSTLTENIVYATSGHRYPLTTLPWATVSIAISASITRTLLQNVRTTVWRATRQGLFGFAGTQ